VAGKILRRAALGQHVLDDAVLHADLQGIVEPIEETAEGGAQGQLDDLRFGEMFLQLLEDGEVDIAISFYPSDAASLIETGRLPESARSFDLSGGTIGNTHFVAIPFNARSKEGAMVLANFLMSPEAQARKQDLEVWGDATVLDLAKLSPTQRRAFDALPKHPALLPPEALGPTLLEPHPSWMTRIEAEWQRRFSG